MAAYGDIVLEELSIGTYGEGVALGTDELLRRMDENRPSLQPSDAFLALLVLTAVRELREMTRSLDAAGTRLNWLLAIVAVLALAVAIVQLATAL